MNCLPIAFTSPSERDAVKDYVRRAYQDLRFFHGTNQSSLESIRRNGMSMRLKKQEVFA